MWPIHCDYRSDRFIVYKVHHDYIPGAELGEGERGSRACAPPNLPQNSYVIYL